MLDRPKALYKLKRQADEMQRVLSGISVEVEYKGVKVTMLGNQEVRKVEVDGEEFERLKEAFNKAVKESQKKAAKKMQGFAGDLGIPGF